MSLLLLLPPSEGKSPAVGTGPSFAKACPDYAHEVAPVLRHLRGLPARERIRWYGVSTQEKADAAHALNLAALTAPGLPAIQRYTGVVYVHLAYATLPDKPYADDHLFILSGLFGLIPANAPIPDYKLPMNPWLANHWRETNGHRLATLAQGDTVLSLLPQAHARALGHAEFIPIDFKLADGAKSAGHFGKAIKGRFARYVLKRKAKDLKSAARFKEQNYRFDGSNFIQASPDLASGTID